MKYKLLKSCKIEPVGEALDIAPAMRLRSEEDEKEPERNKREIKRNERVEKGARNRK